MFQYGKHVYGQSFLNYLNSNLDFLVTGRILGAEQLGYYQFAYNLPRMALNLVTERITDILFPLFSKVQKDVSRLRQILPESLQSYLGARRKIQALEEATGEMP